MPEFLAVQRDGPGVRIGPFRPVGIQQEGLRVVGTGGHVILARPGIAEDVGGPQPDPVTLDLFRDILQVQGFPGIGPMEQVVRPDDVVIVRAPLHPAIASQSVIIVPGTEEIHPSVEDMRLAVRDIQAPAGWKDRILGLVAHGDQAAVLRTGPGIARDDPGVAVGLGQDLAPVVHLRHPSVGRCPFKAAGHGTAYLDPYPVSGVQHRGNPVQGPGAVLRPAGAEGGQDGQK